MHGIVTWIQDVAIPFLGLPGIFLASFLDSSFLSLPELNDLLMVTSCSAQPRRALLYLLATTSGSVVGCSVLWWIGMQGGEAFFVKRFGRDRVERTRATFERWGLLTLAIPAILPPPAPFKIFVIAAGVFEMSFWRFVLTVGIARGLRYGIWCVLGMYYGERAARVLRAFDPWVRAHRWPLLLGALAVVGLSLGALWLWRRHRRSAT